MVPVQQKEQGGATMLERSLSLSTCCSVPHGIPPPSCCSGSCDICSETLRVPPWDTPPLLPPHADVAVPWSGAGLRSASGPFEVWWNGMERAAQGPWELVEVCVSWGGLLKGQWNWLITISLRTGAEGWVVPPLLVHVPTGWDGELSGAHYECCSLCLSPPILCSLSVLSLAPFSSDLVCCVFLSRLFSYTVQATEHPRWVRVWSSFSQISSDVAVKTK